MDYNINNMGCTGLHTRVKPQVLEVDATGIYALDTSLMDAHCQLQIISRYRSWLEASMPAFEPSTRPGGATTDKVVNVSCAYLSTRHLFSDENR